MDYQPLIQKASDWFHTKNQKPFEFQIKCWEAYFNEKSGLLNAPTGSGKTYAIWLPAVLKSYHREQVFPSKIKGIRILWITPLRALAKDIRSAMQLATNELGIPWTIGLRTGDITSAEKAQQKKEWPPALVITPESLHVILAQSDYPFIFSDLESIIVDEWHELIGTKRGVAVELAISRIRKVTKQKLKVWGISATIGNLKQASRVLLGEEHYKQAVFITAEIKKKLEVFSVLPDEIEKFPWSGHLGVQLLHKIYPIIEQSVSTLLFTNTRSQTELWYQALLNEYPKLAGQLAMHHGSMDPALRQWVEEALGDGKLKCVVCTSSLDLGVDFRPVDTVIQIGGPKGVSRFQQRAGRSGHRPGAVSRIFFVPTHSLELIEAAALRDAINQEEFEARKPLELCFDVLVQYLVTLAVGGGFRPMDILSEIKATYCFRLITSDQWLWVLRFITTGGTSLEAYDEFVRVFDDQGIFKVISRKVATRHRLSIGTIVGDPSLKVRFISGGYLGTVEEYFISRLNPGDSFWFAGQNLEYIQIKDMTVLVRKSRKGKGPTPAWGGGRLPLSSLLADKIVEKLQEASKGEFHSEEMKKIKPILELQKSWSQLPSKKTLVIERTQTHFGHHIFIFPFEGMFIHELLAGLVAYRISTYTNITFSLSMNDYGFELLSDQRVPIEEALELDVFSLEKIYQDTSEAINKAEMAKRKFRDIAVISGLIFQGYPGEKRVARHLQASASILYGVFENYDHNNLLLKQASEEVMNNQLEYGRFLDVLRRINECEIKIFDTPKPSPFAFPIFVDSLRRESLSSEQLIQRIQKVHEQEEK